MTIEKGEDWGHHAPLPAEGLVVADDAEARRVVEEHRRAGSAPPPLGLLGGDLWRALGAPDGGADRLRGPDAMTFPVDLGEVLVDGRLFVFVSHLIARRSWWRGRILAAMNTEWCGPWRISPRAHPNDGRLEVVDANPSLAQRWLARGRLRTGDHLPHPDMRVTRPAAAQFEMQRPTPVYLDGERVAAGRYLSVRVEPDALTVVV